MDDKQATGKLGEKKAAEFLEEKGYTIVERNFRHRRGEIDLIARKENLLLFAEVKTRTGNADWGYPEEAVTNKKARKVVSCANAYIFKVNWKEDIRFDIISVELGESVLITHFEDAFH